LWVLPCGRNLLIHETWKFFSLTFFAYGRHTCYLRHIGFDFSNYQLRFSYFHYLPSSRTGMFSLVRENKRIFYLLDHERCLTRFDFFASACLTPALALIWFDFFTKPYLRSIMTPTMYPTKAPTHIAPKNPIKYPPKVVRGV
jgi:hypothetical protein